jgi:hypothetical protein
MVPLGEAPVRGAGVVNPCSWGMQRGDEVTPLAKPERRFPALARSDRAWLAKHDKDGIFPIIFRITLNRSERVNGALGLSG